MFQQLNCILWILTEPNKDIKKDIDLDKINIIIDLSI